MPTRQSKRKTSELKVVFDTNILWTGSESDLVKHEVAQLIQDNSKYADLTILWYLPAIVRHERQFQMLRQAKELLPSIQRLEKLLGHNLNINEEIVAQRVNEAVEKQLRNYNFQSLIVDTKQVDWNRVMHDSAYRIEPFENKDKTEKGFRDAVIVEAVVQLVEASPTTPSVCRVVVVTADKLLTNAITRRTSTATNLRIFSSLEEVRTLINTLVSEVSEEEVAVLQAQAQKYFFVPNDKETFYFREDVHSTINNTFDKELTELPQGAEKRKITKWIVSPPQFIRKEAQRVSWVNSITISSQAYKVIPVEHNPVYGEISVFGSDRTSPYLLYSNQNRDQTSLSGILGTAPLLQNSQKREILVANGVSVFEVHWSITVGTHRRFTAPKIDEVRFIETTWEIVS